MKPFQDLGFVFICDVLQWTDGGGLTWWKTLVCYKSGGEPSLTAIQNTNVLSSPESIKILITIFLIAW